MCTWVRYAVNKNSQIEEKAEMVTATTCVQTWCVIVKVHACYLLIVLMHNCENVVVDSTASTSSRLSNVVCCTRTLRSESVVSQFYFPVNEERKRRLVAFELILVCFKTTIHLNEKRKGSFVYTHFIWVRIHIAIFTLMLILFAVL